MGRGVTRFFVFGSLVFGKNDFGAKAGLNLVDIFKYASIGNLLDLCPFVKSACKCRGFQQMRIKFYLP
jgi:hypothetical protein